MYEKILVPLDGSTFAESALPLALTLSRKTGAAVHLVTVQQEQLFRLVFSRVMLRMCFCSTLFH